MGKAARPPADRRPEGACHPNSRQVLDKLADLDSSLPWILRGFDCKEFVRNILAAL